MPRVGGFKQALDMLSQLDHENAQRLLADIAKKDPELAQLLNRELVTLEDLKFISTKMLVELFREIELSDMGMALRIGSEELKTYILNNISSGMAREIKDILEGPPQQRNKVNEAIERIMLVVRAKVANKELIIDKNAEEVV